jgi:outer membrane murein-binding lipoprotein Lpp
MLELLGLKDDYSHDGRVLFEALTSNALPTAVRAHLNYYVGLARIYKQINASVGQLALDTLQISTRALASSSTGDATYTKLEKQIQQINTQRDTLASHIIALLEKVEFANNDDTQQATTLTNQGTSLLTNSKQAASSK